MTSNPNIEPPVNLVALRVFPRHVFDAVSKTYGGEPKDDKEFRGTIYRPLYAFGMDSLSHTCAGALAWAESQNKENLSFSSGVSLLNRMPRSEKDMGLEVDFEIVRLLHLGIGMRLHTDHSLIGSRNYILKISTRFPFQGYEFSQYPQYHAPMLEMFQMMSVLPKQELFAIREKIPVAA